MKKVFLAVALIYASTALFAQKDGIAPLAKGEQQLNFGLGFSTQGIPIYVSYDFSVHKDVTITPQINIKFDDNIRFGVLFKADYHWNYLIGIPNNWDFYSGARIGIDFGEDVDLDLGIQVGGRWYWSERWGLNLEIAGGTGFGTVVGVSMKVY
jgi:hypothetical protein